MWFKLAVCAVGGYLLGCISFGIVLSKAFSGRDIRKSGSGNTGATNMLRTLGWLPAVLTLVGDAVKAAAAAYLGGVLAGPVGTAVAGVCAVAGHNWPVFHHFKGGKGMSASLGVTAVMDWRIAVIEFLIQVIIVALTRYMSLASAITAVMLPVLMCLFHPGDLACILPCLILCLMALWGHVPNFRRLIAHNENRLDFQRIHEISNKKKGSN